MRRALAVLVSGFMVSGVLIACGGATKGSSATAGTTVTGTVKSTSFDVGSSFAFVTSPSSSECNGSPDGGVSCTTTTDPGQVLAVAITNRSDITCSTVDTAQDATFANLQSLFFGVATTKENIAPGTFAIVAESANVTSGALGMFETTTGTCAVAENLTATAGTVTVTAISATEVAGSYDLTFGTSGSFSGSFSLSLCGVPDGGFAESPDAGRKCLQ